MNEEGIKESETPWGIFLLEIKKGKFERKNKNSRNEWVKNILNHENCKNFKDTRSVCLGSECSHGIDGATEL